MTRNEIGNNCAECINNQNNREGHYGDEPGFCLLRQVLIPEPFWTTCQNFSDRHEPAPTQQQIQGPIYIDSGENPFRSVPVYDWNAYLSSLGYDPGPSQARAVLNMLDELIRSYGLQPEDTTDARGWRILTMEKTIARANVVQWEPGLYFLVIYAPIAELPLNDQRFGPLYRRLLEFNHNGSYGARFAIDERTVHVSLVRPVSQITISDLDANLRMVLTVARNLGDQVRQAVQELVKLDETGSATTQPAQDKE
ncbi:MAG: hypothetical protein EXR62_09805 [Chloroflexi bacterium]|nr:hypothetical protein [Chloroflexota bacterium]